MGEIKSPSLQPAAGKVSSEKDIARADEGDDAYFLFSLARAHRSKYAPRKCSPDELKEMFVSLAKRIPLKWKDLKSRDKTQLGTDIIKNPGPNLTTLMRNGWDKSIQIISFYGKNKSVNRIIGYRDETGVFQAILFDPQGEAYGH